MAQRLPMSDGMSFGLQLKQLADEELLDFWTQTQQIEGSLREDYPHLVPNQDYERLIVLELQLRSCSRMSAARC